MVQMAYRTKYCGWTLEQATDEIARTFGLVEVAHGPDYRHMESFYNERVLPNRPPQARAATAAAAQLRRARFDALESPAPRLDRRSRGSDSAHSRRP